jgi:hypothetical protein
MTQELPEGTVTVLFSDVVGSTDLTTSRGDEAAQDILRAQRELVRGQVEQRSGHEVKSIGDGFMVAFGSARRAVACAVGIQRALEEHNRSQPLDEQVQVRRWYARMLIDRAQTGARPGDGPGDRDKARQLLTETVAMYRKIGMPKHVEMVEKMLGEV